MKKLKFCVVTSFFIIFILNGVIVVGSFQNQKNEPGVGFAPNQSANSFYFIQITDTHVAINIYDNGTRKHGLLSLLQNITSFETPPAFVVITGDLVEWGEGFFGARNYNALLHCFYGTSTQWYIDKECSIPVYFTPGNHDHYPYRVLLNYHRFVHRVPLKDHDHYVVTYQDLSLFFMDSGPNSYATLSDKVNSRAVGLTDDDMLWLEEHLQTCPTTHKIILMHHPAINLRNQDGDMYDVFIDHREPFIALCEKYDVDAVLAGHTHEARVFNATEHLYENLPMNCSMYPTLFVQSDDCKEGVHYRNISLMGHDLWIEPSQKINVTCYSSNVHLPSPSRVRPVPSETPLRCRETLWNLLFKNT